MMRPATEITVVTTTMTWPRQAPEGINAHSTSTWPKQDWRGEQIRKSRAGVYRPPYFDVRAWRDTQPRVEAYLAYRQELENQATKPTAKRARSRDTATGNVVASLSNSRPSLPVLAETQLSMEATSKGESEGSFQDGSRKSSSQREPGGSRQNYACVQDRFSALSPPGPLALPDDRAGEGGGSNALRASFSSRVSGGAARSGRRHQDPWGNAVR